MDQQSLLSIEELEYNKGGLYSPMGQSVVYNPEANEFVGIPSSQKHTD